ncbi:MAG TPA: aldehyde dehydrogenase (NADP(+)) [Ktedonobacteraceae bacterium]
MSTSAEQPVLVAGQWRASRGPVGTFQAENPATGAPLPPIFPVSSRDEVLETVQAASLATQELHDAEPESIAAFLERFADLIEASREELVLSAHLETGLPEKTRLDATELPRTTNQLRQAAQAARERVWTRPVIDTKLNIRATHAPLGGPIVIFGPNNFPFAFNAISGGDFAAALAARNPVIARANPGHPATTRLLANLAVQALQESGLPAASIQLLYHFTDEVGLELVSHSALGATGFTGSKNAGLKLKEAADRAGKPIYLELSSVNPVFILPGALEERLDAIAGEFCTSCTMGAGQFCTNPGLIVVPAGALGESFLQAATSRFQQAAPGVLFSRRGIFSLENTLRVLTDYGAQLVTGGHPLEGSGYGFAPTLLRVSGQDFLRQSLALQTEAFGPASLLIFAADAQQTLEIACQLDGNLTGTVYSHSGDQDDAFYQRLEPLLRTRVGRLLNDKMPTGVAVSPAMNHGGPFPATGHPGFTSVGLPAAIDRFTRLYSYDNVRSRRLPAELQDKNPTGYLWRVIDGIWTQGDVS